MEYDDLNSNFTYTNASYETKPDQVLHFLSLEIIFTLLCTIGVLIDSVIIYVIVRYDRLYRSPDFVILINWILADILFLVVMPSGYRIISIIDVFTLSAEFNCSLYQTGKILHGTKAMFASLLVVDWGLKAYCQKISVKFRYHYVQIMYGLWILSIISIVVSSAICYTRNGYHCLPHVFYYYFFGLNLILITFLHIMRGIQKCRNIPSSYPTLMLTLVSTNIASVGFSILLVIGANYEISLLLAIFVGCGLFSTSETNLILLYVLSQDFQACFDQAFKSINQYNDEWSNQEAENDDRLTSSVESSDSNRVQLTFSEDQQELIR